MDNQELELKIKEILAIENFFDMVEAAIAFEKNYKGTNFYKRTKMPFIEVLKNSKAWYLIQLKDLSKNIQSLLNNLNFENLTNIISQLGEVYASENKEMLDIIEGFKEIVK